MNSLPWERKMKILATTEQELSRIFQSFISEKHFFLMFVDAGWDNLEDQLRYFQISFIILTIITNSDKNIYYTAD